MLILDRQLIGTLNGCKKCNHKTEVEICNLHKTCRIYRYLATLAFQVIQKKNSSILGNTIITITIYSAVFLNLFKNLAWRRGNALGLIMVQFLKEKLKIPLLYLKTKGKTNATDQKKIMESQVR